MPCTTVDGVDARHDGRAFGTRFSVEAGLGGLAELDSVASAYKGSLKGILGASGGAH